MPGVVALSTAGVPSALTSCFESVVRNPAVAGPKPTQTMSTSMRGRSMFGIPDMGFLFCCSLSGRLTGDCFLLNFVTNVKSYFAPFRFWRGWRFHQFFDFVKNEDDGLFVIVEPRGQFALQFREFGRQFLALGQDLAHLHECAHHENTHPRRARAVQNIGSHDCTVLGEGQREFPAATASFL